MSRVHWVTDRAHPVDVRMLPNTRPFARKREGGYTLAKSIYKADVFIASSNWAVSKALRAYVYTKARERAEVASKILRGHRDTGNSSIEVKKGAADTSVFLRDPYRLNAKGEQIGGAAYAVEGQTQALGTAFGTEFVRPLRGWKEMYGSA